MQRDDIYIPPFLALINRLQPSRNTPDRWRWKLTPGGRYSTNSTYSSIIEGVALPQETLPQVDTLRLVWCKLMPLKVSTMARRLLWDRLPTITNLARRNVQLTVDNMRCHSCNFPEETTQHLFISCPKASEVWSACYLWLGTLVVQPQDIVSHFVAHAGILRSAKDKKLAIGIWECVVWALWKVRNNFIFNGK